MISDEGWKPNILLPIKIGMMILGIRYRYANARIKRSLFFKAHFIKHLFSLSFLTYISLLVSLYPLVTNILTKTTIHKMVPIKYGDKYARSTSNMTSK